MRRSPLQPSDPAEIRAWRERSQQAKPLRAVGFTVTIYDGGAESAPPQRTPIRKVSAKRARENQERTAMADRRWPDRREGTVMCAVPWCTLPADDLNERLPRARGGSITDEDNVDPVCRGHNEELTHEPEWGYRLGFLKHSWGGGGGDAA